MNRTRTSTIVKWRWEHLACSIAFTLDSLFPNSRRHSRSTSTTFRTTSVSNTALCSSTSFLTSWSASTRRTSSSDTSTSRTFTLLRTVAIKTTQSTTTWTACRAGSSQPSNAVHSTRIAASLRIWRSAPVPQALRTRRISGWTSH